MLAPPVTTGRARLRVLHYCHDTYGLGHLRRTLALAHRLRERRPDATQLIVSGAAYTEGWSLPEGADWIKLPAVVKAGADDYRPRSLQCSFETVRSIRAETILAASRAFRPDIFVVDHVPSGLEGEALPALHQASAAGARLVLGLRDVLDDAARVRRAWREGGTHALLDRLYDRIVIYGDPGVYDVVAEYGFAPDVAAKTRYVGYLRAPRPPAGRSVRAEFGVGDDDRLLVVTAGGGGDGFVLLSTALEALAAAPPPRTFALVVTGPLMSGADRAELRRRAAACGSRVRLLASVPELADAVAAADGIVSMGGYNTVREILTYRRPALIVPRVRPRLEQLIRAEALAAHGLVRMLHPAQATPGAVAEELERLLDAPPAPVDESLLDGLDGFVDVVDELVETPTLVPAVAHG